MGIYLFDLLDGSAGPLVDHKGQEGAIWSYHPLYNNQSNNSVVLDGLGNVVVYPQSYSDGTIVIASGVPTDEEWDFRSAWKFHTIIGDGTMGVVFGAHPTADSYFRLLYSTYSDFKKFELTSVIHGTATSLGTYALEPAAGAVVNVEIRKRATGAKYRVAFDGVEQLTSSPEVDTGGDRFGFAVIGSGGSGSAPDQGLAWESISAGSVGFVLPDYTVTGPSSGPPGFVSEPFDVKLVPGQNPGPITIEPSVSGITGVLDPTSVDLTDTDRKKMFTFKPSRAGTGTLSFTNNIGMPDVGVMTYRSAYEPPIRLKYWEGFWQKFHTTGEAPYLAGETNPDGSGGYWLDGDDHYDPILVYLMVQDYCLRYGLSIDWCDQILAGIVRFRDRAVRADPGITAGETYGVQEYHRHGSGIAWYHRITTDPSELAKNIEAMGYLNKTNFTNYASLYGHTGTYREAAFILLTLLDYQLMGLGDVTENIKVAIEVCLYHNVPTAVQGSGRQWGVSIKPFMVGINNLALARAWELFRHSPDPSMVSLVDQIPENIQGICQYMRDVCWYPEGVTVETEDCGPWDRGAIAYKDLALSDPLFTPIRELAITAVWDRYTFRGPESLSTVDDYYKGASLLMNHPVDGQIADVWLISEYLGATREFVVEVGYRPYFDFDESWTFDLVPAAWQPLEQDGDRGPTPSMNLMAIFGFAFTYWHKRRILRDEAGSGEWRNWTHKLFNGASQAWTPPYNCKLMNQGTYLAIPALEYLYRGDVEWPTAYLSTWRRP